MKNYRARVTQIGADIPIETVAYSDLGEITWTRLSPGAAKGTCTGAFPADRTTIQVTPLDAGGEVMFCSTAQRISDNEILIAMHAPIDGDGHDIWAINLSIVVDEDVYQTV